MQNALIVALIAGLGAMLGWGISDFFAKKSVDKVGPTASLFWMQLFGLLPLIILFLSKYSLSSLLSVDIRQLIILGIVDSVGYLLFYNALEKGKVSIVGPIVASYSAFSLLFAAVYFKETLPIATILALLIVASGIVIASLDYKELIKSGIKSKDFAKGVPQALFAVLILSAWFPFWGKFVVNNDWVISLLILRTVISLTLLTFLLIKKEKIIVDEKRVTKWLFAVGMLDVIAYIALTWGYSATTYLSVVTVLSATFSIPTLILARIFLKEKLQKVQLIGIGIILLGVAALAFI